MGSGSKNETTGTRFSKSFNAIGYNMTKQEMLDILSELAQGEHIWRNDKDDLLNFIEEIREMLSNNQ